MAFFSVKKFIASKKTPKGHLISKLGLSISSKKRTKKFDFTTMITQVDLFSLVFFEEIYDPKKILRN